MMPADMSKYPDNWQEIRERILRRAGGQDDDPRIGARCELFGNDLDMSDNGAYKLTECAKLQKVGE